MFKIYQTAFNKTQAEVYNQQIDKGIYPVGTESIKALSDPAAVVKGVKTKGNGLANLGIIRTFVADLVAENDLAPGIYNLKDLLGKRLVLGIHGGGQSARNPKFTLIGKFNGILPIESILKEGKATTLQEELLVFAAVINEEYPGSGYLNFYGDALITLNVEEVKAFFAAHPEAVGETTIFVRKVPAAEAPIWGCAAVNEEKMILNFKEKPTKGLADSERKEALARDSLLIDGESVLMNTAFAIFGVNAVIRLARLAGIDIDFEGNFEVVKKDSISVPVYMEVNALILLQTYGGEIDTFGHLVPPLAKNGDMGELVFKDLEKALKGVNEDSGVKRHISEEVSRLRKSLSSDENIEAVGEALDMIIESLQNQIQSSEVAESRVLQRILEAVGLARTYQEIVSVMRHEGAGSHSYAVPIEGEWLDTGMIKEELNIFLGIGEANRRLRLVFDIVDEVGSKVNAYAKGLLSHRVASILNPEDGQQYCPEFHTGIIKVKRYVAAWGEEPDVPGELGW